MIQLTGIYDVAEYKVKKVERRTPPKTKSEVTFLLNSLSSKIQFLTFKTTFSPAPLYHFAPLHIRIISPRSASATGHQPL